jgi:hypothetical protein
MLTRNEWEHVAMENGADFINIEIVCSDVVEHQKRAQHRTNEIAGLTLPGWEEIQKRVYHPWHKKVIRVDTAGKRIQESFDFLMRMIN